MQLARTKPWAQGCGSGLRASLIGLRGSAEVAEVGKCRSGADQGLGPLSILLRKGSEFGHHY